MERKRADKGDPVRREGLVHRLHRVTSWHAAGRPASVVFEYFAFCGKGWKRTRRPHKACSSIITCLGCIAA